MGFFNNPITKLVKDRYTDGGAGINNLDFSNIAKDLGAAGALYGVINPNDSSGLASFFGTGGQQQPVGYTGGIPNYTATRELAPNAFAPTYATPTGEVAARRPGMAGRRYFTDTQFTQSTDEPFMGVTAEQIADQDQAAIDEQALFESILGNIENQRSDNSEGISTQEANLIFTALDQNFATLQEVADYYGFTTDEVLQAYRDMGGTEFAQGGNVNGYYLGGTTDGMADNIPATIDNMQPAALSDGEFVVPADVVSHLGNGNSDAGAQNLYSMMERVRTDRTGNPEQGRQIDPNKYLA
tara:strand:+ start:35 stop:928 length:894 start_codon:yes stop_codon:yes gene_type:complete